MNSFLNDIKKNTYGIYKKHEKKNKNKFKIWLNDRVEKKEPKKEEESKPSNLKEEEKNNFSGSENFVKYFFIPGLIFIILGILQVCIFKKNNFIISDETLSPYIDHRPFKWGTSGTTWYGQWFGIMQTKSWSWLATLYSKYFESLNSTFNVVEATKDDDIASKIVKGFGKFWVVFGLGFMYSIIWISQCILGWLLPASQAFRAFFSAAPENKDGKERGGMIDRIIGYVGLFFSAIPVVFFTWLLQLHYLPFLLWKNRKEKNMFTPFSMIYTNETNTGIFTSIVGWFLTMLTISLLLLGNKVGLIIGGVTLLLLGLFTTLSIFNWYSIIKNEKVEIPSKPKKIVKPENNDIGTNFPIDNINKKISVIDKKMQGGNRNKTRKKKY